MTPTTFSSDGSLEVNVITWTLFYLLTTHSTVQATIQSQATLLRNIIDHDFSSAHIPDTIYELPRRRHTTPSEATLIAKLVFPEFSEVKADIQYEIALSHARRVVRQRKELIGIRQRLYGNDSIASETQVGRFSCYSRTNSTHHFI